MSQVHNWERSMTKLYTDCHLAYLSYMQSTSCEMQGRMNHKLDSIPRRCIYNRRRQILPLSWQTAKELKSLLMKVEEEKWKSWLKTRRKAKIVASSPITSWLIDGEKVEKVTDVIFLGSKITTGGDCSHEIKRHLLLGRKAMTNLDSVLKSRDITLLTKVHLVKPMVFPVVMCGCESWTIKKAVCWRIDAFKLWC